MTPWIIVALLVILLYVQHVRSLRSKVHMAEYILIMYSDEEMYHAYRNGFLDVVRSWSPEKRENTLWLDSTTTLINFIPSWGRRDNPTLATEMALKSWMESEGLISPSEEG